MTDLKVTKKIGFIMFAWIFIFFSATISSVFAVEKELGADCVSDSDCGDVLVCGDDAICNYSDEDQESAIEDLFDDFENEKITKEDFIKNYEIIAGEALTDEEKADLVIDEAETTENTDENTDETDEAETTEADETETTEDTDETDDEVSFPDVANNKYKDSIIAIAKKGIVHGNPDGTYKPDSNINRAEFTTIVINAIMDEKDVSGKNCFPDIEEEWYAKFVCTAKKEGIISGNPDGNFAPTDNINLAEASTILVNAFKDKLTLEDEKDGEQWYDRFLVAINIKDIDVDQEVTHSITRGEMAEIIYSLVK